VVLRQDALVGQGRPIFFPEDDAYAVTVADDGPDTVGYFCGGGLTG